MRLLITRPADDAAALAAALAPFGIETRLEPLLTIVQLPGPRLVLDRTQALLATSANGVRALAARTEERRLPLLAVGDATARAARELGFADVESAAGDVVALAALVRRRLDPAAGPLLHAAGTAVAGDLAALLAADGFEVRREVVYEARPAAALSPSTVAGLAAGELDAVVLYSPRTARRFRTLVTAAGLAAACRQLVAFALSSAVADALQGLPWRRVIVADRPEQARLIDAIVAFRLESASGGNSHSTSAQDP